MSVARWPMRIVRGQGPCFIVCKRARSVDDPQHVPEPIFGFPLFTYCVCGNRVEDDHKLLPAY